jgi:hypothetical protein
LAIGVASSFLFPAATIGTTVFTGLVVGLSASGLYSGANAVSGAVSLVSAYTKPSLPKPQ